MLASRVSTPAGLTREIPRLSERVPYVQMFAKPGVRTHPPPCSSETMASSKVLARLVVRKQNGLAIFRFAKEDRHKTVAMDVLRRSLFHIGVCLVEQKNGVPTDCLPTYSSKRMLEVLSLGAQLCSRYMQRLSHGAEGMATQSLSSKYVSNRDNSLETRSSPESRN